MTLGIDYGHRQSKPTFSFLPGWIFSRIHSLPRNKKGGHAFLLLMLPDSSLGTLLWQPSRQSRRGSWSWSQWKWGTTGMPSVQEPLKAGKGRSISNVANPRADCDISSWRKSWREVAAPHVWKVYPIFCQGPSHNCSFSLTCILDTWDQFWEPPVRVGVCQVHGGSSLVSLILIENSYRACLWVAFYQTEWLLFFGGRHATLQNKAFDWQGT